MLRLLTPVRPLAFSVASSAAVMPMSIKAAEARLGVSPETARFVIPVGTILNMSGTAAYQAVAALFLAQVYGLRPGLPSGYPLAEDWCWFIEFITPGGAEFSVLCGNVDVSRERWFLSLRRHARGLFGRGKPPWGPSRRLPCLLFRVPPRLSARGGACVPAADQGGRTARFETLPAWRLHSGADY